MLFTHPTATTVLQHPFFKHFGQAEQERLMAQSHEQAFSAGELLIQQGQLAERFFLVLSGRVKLYRISADGQEKVVEIIQAGQTFAEAVMFMQRSEYPVCAETLEAVQLVSVPNRLMLTLLQENPQACLRLLGHTSMRLHQRLGELETLTLQNATQRFALYLIQQLEDRSQERVDIELPLPKRLVAARLSMQPETLSRIMARLNQEGLIEMNGRNIHIPSISRLLEPFG